MRMYDIIETKRDGGKLSEEQIKYLVRGYVSGEIPDYQMSAFLMAVYLRGMDNDETVWLTEEMRKSGETLDLSRFGGRAVDKHSTGGVGDKTSIIVAPIVACCGAVMAKMSGRGLGHTGGTVDKLESIPGYNVSLSPSEFMSQAESVGIALIGQTGNMTPADKLIYSLRNSTATIESIPLIASSIMSKKLAAGADTIVLDVKYGSGAFMKTKEDAAALARVMVSIGKDCGKKTAALITDMDAPIGYAVGNSLEIAEAVDALAGRGSEKLKNLCLALCAEILAQCNDTDYDSAMKKALDALESGKALSKFREWIAAQGGDTCFTENPDEFRKARYIKEYKAKSDGYIRVLDALKIGKASFSLGAGRQKKDDEIDYRAGIVLSCEIGDAVSRGDTVATLYSDTVSDFSEAEGLIDGAVLYSVNRQPVTEEKLLIID